MTRQTMFAVSAAVGFVLSAIDSPAHAQVYKCQDSSGKTVYADAPCTAGGKPLGLQDPARQGGANATACAQLLDETRRLAADAERDAKRGMSVDASNAKRRQTLTGEYHRRCAAISKSPR